MDTRIRRRPIAPAAGRTSLVAVVVAAGLLAIAEALLIAAAVPPPAAATPLVRSFPVCTDAANQRHPTVGSRTSVPFMMDRVVWQDWGRSGASGWDIYSYDLATGREIPLCTAVGSQMNPAVSVAAVWQDQRKAQSGGGADMDIWGWQLDQVAHAGSGVPIDTSASEQLLPDTDTNTAAWLTVTDRTGDQDDWKSDVLVMWLPDGSSIRLPRGQMIDDLGLYQPADGVSPVVVVWSERPGFTVRAAELRRANNHLEYARELEMAHKGIAEWAPDVGGGRIVFVRTAAAANLDLVSYDLRTGKETVVYRKPRNAMEPAVSGDFCVFTTAAAGTTGKDLDIYGCNLKTKTVFPICTAPDDQMAPAISGSIVVWEDYRNDSGVAGNCDIQAAQIDTTPPRVYAPRKAAVQRGGKARLAFKVKDNKAAKAKVTVVVKKGKKKVKSVRVGWRKVRKLGYAKFRCTLKPGTYRYYVYAVDEAGNPQKKARSNTLVVR